MRFDRFPSGARDLHLRYLARRGLPGTRYSSRNCDRSGGRAGPRPAKMTALSVNKLFVPMVERAAASARSARRRKCRLNDVMTSTTGAVKRSGTFALIAAMCLWECREWQPTD
jgi:hypothetical protein